MFTAVRAGQLCLSCSETAHTRRRSCNTHTHLCNEYTHTHSFRWMHWFFFFFFLLTPSSVRQTASHYIHFDWTGLCIFIHVHIEHKDYVKHCSGGEIIYSPSRTSWCHPWRPAARWWTPGSVWLSGEASPSPQNVRSFLKYPLCIRATPL